MKYISYSQYTQYINCPKQYELTYIHKLSIHKPSIHTIIGTSVHETIQYYYNNNKHEFDYKEYLLNRIEYNLTRELDVYEEKFISNNELISYYNSFSLILDIFFKNNNTYIDNKYEYIANEYEIKEHINILLSENNYNIGILGYLDLLFKYNDDYIIYDIKTSNKLWSKQQKNDLHKLSQLYIYKKLLSKKLNIPESNIKIYYIIFSIENNNIELYEPTINENNDILTNINQFITDVFTINGEFINKQFPITINEDNCIWCEYKGTPYCSKYNLSI